MYPISEVLPTTSQLVGAAMIGFAWYRLTYHPWTLRDWCQHVFILGSIGSGKSVLARNLALKGIQAGAGLVFICPQGSARNMLKLIPSDHVSRVVMIQPYGHRVVGINLLHRYTGTAEERQLIAADVTAIFAQLYKGSWGDVIAQAFRFATLAVLEYSDRTKRPATIVDVYRFLVDEEYQEEVSRFVDNAVVANFARLYAPEDNKRTIRKLETPLANESFIATFGQSQGLDLFQAMQERKIILVDLDEAYLGEDAKLFASIIISCIRHAAAKRHEHSPVVMVVADEFQTYAGRLEDLATMIELMRKKNVALCLACQHLEQLSERVRHAAFLAKTQYVFRPTLNDVPTVARQFKHEGFEPEMFYGLPNYVTICREHIGGRDKVRRWKTPRPAREHDNKLPPQGRYRHDVLREIKASFHHDEPPSVGRLQVL